MGGPGSSEGGTLAKLKPQRERTGWTAGIGMIFGPRRVPDL